MVPFCLAELAWCLLYSGGGAGARAIFVCGERKGVACGKLARERVERWRGSWGNKVVRVLVRERKRKQDAKLIQARQRVPERSQAFQPVQTRSQAATKSRFHQEKRGRNQTSPNRAGKPFARRLERTARTVQSPRKWRKFPSLPASTELNYAGRP